MNKLKYPLNLLMLASFLLCGITGLVKFPEFQRYFGLIIDNISASNLTMLHDWSGLILLVSIIIHLIMKRVKIFPINPKEYWLANRKGISIILFILAAAITLLFLARKPGAIRLSGVEVREYQGEKLDSISDFRENSIKGPQYIDKENYRLEISGLVDEPAAYSYGEILGRQQYQKAVDLNCVEGWDANILWEGVRTSDLLSEVNISPRANTIIFYAYDGYSTSFPLDYIMDNDILLADKMNGVELPPERGFPFQLVAEDKWGYKWIKWVTKIELSEDADYQGYWESRGYNNNGDLSGSKYSE